MLHSGLVECMALTDLSLEALQAYRGARSEPDDFDAFWARTLETARGHDLNPVFTPVRSGLPLIDVSDVSFSGYGGQRIKAWLAMPAGGTEPLPCVVELPGYGGGRGLPHDLLLYAAAGYAHLFVDVRGQGSGWRSGDTPDLEGSGPQYPGFMTRGIDEPDTYYYRRVITDAVRAIGAARTHPRIDAARVAVAGESQGGGLAIAMAGLVPDLVGAAADVPFLCHFRRAMEVATAGPYLELVQYLKVQRQAVDTVLHTLSYVDSMNFAARAGCPALFSVALMDNVCPPSTVYAAYHHYGGACELRVYPYNEHEGGQSHQTAARLAFLARIFSSSA
jgi:cephalosporin-C deacetylase